MQTPTTPIIAHPIPLDKTSLCGSTKIRANMNINVKQA